MVLTFYSVAGGCIKIPQVDKYTKTNSVREFGGEFWADTNWRVFDSASRAQDLRCFLWGTMPKANSADLWRTGERRGRHSGAP